MICFCVLEKYELSAAGQRLTFRGRSRACTNKMASTSAKPSPRYLQLIEGNSEGEHRPVPSTIARDRSLESTSGNYKRRGNSDITKVPLYERVKQFPGENLIVREGKLFCSGCREIISSKKSVLKSIFRPRSVKTAKRS